LCSGTLTDHGSAFIDDQEAVAQERATCASLTRSIRVEVTIAAVSGLAEEPLASFLDAVAEPTPAPGGGTSAAVVAGLGAALVEMAARLAGESEAASRAGALRWRALELAEQELSSYAPVLEARRRPGADRAARVEEALLEASRSPLAIAELAAEVAELGAAVARASSPSVRGDALTGTVVAEAAAAAAAGLVEINLADQPSAPALAAARSTRARAEQARADAAAG
jgi:formiminotetrahydrofolate cyclodeaminase